MGMQIKKTKAIMGSVQRIYSRESKKYVPK
jgi:hypothetical protein